MIAIGIEARQAETRPAEPRYAVREPGPKGSPSLRVRQPRSGERRNPRHSAGADWAESVAGGVSCVRWNPDEERGIVSSVPQEATLVVVIRELLVLLKT